MQNRNIQVRQERLSDYEYVSEVIKESFHNVEHSNGNEVELVKRLRSSEGFIAELSLVAEIASEIVGHIILSPIVIGDIHSSLALAPVSVVPRHQGQGIGGRLIEEAHRKARKLGHGSIVLLGHPGYYPRFGYQRASIWGIKAPFEVPDEVFMAIELTSGALRGVSGVVKYSSAFEIS